MPCSKQEWIERVAESDVTQEEITSLQVAVLHGTILTQSERLMVSRTLGVLGSILEGAREKEFGDEG